ncbi:MAG: NAD(P)/FAD-dependent oxidoreductase [Verrucomicrobiota bacterium]
MSADFDTIVVGAGHNGLVCAAYLAQAGQNVLVLERRPVVGGAVCTQTDLVDGYRFDVGSSVHIMIHLTPVLRDLKLCEDYGLEYIEMDPWGYYPVLGTDQGISFYRDVEKTCESIAEFSTEDAATYRKYVDHWTNLNEGVFETFLQPPSPGNIFKTMLKRNLFGGSRARNVWTSLDTSRQLMAPYGQVIKEYFTSEHVRSALLWLSAQSGPGPDELASGDMFGWNAMIHKSGAWRAKGGSGSLSTSLQSHLEDHGAKIICNAPVTEIEEVDGGWKVVASTGESDEVTSWTACNVVSACHIQTLFGKLLKSPPEPLKKRVEKTRVGNGFGMIVRHAVEELPQYSAREEAHQVQPYHSSMQLLCPSEEYLRSSLRDFQFGQPPQDPSVVAMTFSAIDPSLAPEGKHTLFTWAQYHPYELANGEDWESIAEREADKLYALVCRYAPNMEGKLIDRFIQTPLQIEQMHGLLKGNVMHLEMSLDQMFFFRPLPELAEYKTPMKGLYLTGASTHPGGGVFGASGYNTARVILKEGRS